MSARPSERRRGGSLIADDASSGINNSMSADGRHPGSFALGAGLRGAMTQEHGRLAPSCDCGFAHMIMLGHANLTPACAPVLSTRDRGARG